MKVKNYVWIFILVGVVAGFLIGGVYTGQVVKSVQSSTSATQDKGGTASITYQGVLDMLGKCIQVEPAQSQNRWCSATCKLQNKKTIGYSTIGYSTYISYVALKKDGQRDLHQVPLFGWGDNQPMPSCGDGTTIGCGLAGNSEDLMELENSANATTITIDKVWVYSRCICC